MADNANVAGAPAPAPAAPEAAAPVAAPLVADPNACCLSAKLQIAEMQLTFERSLREADGKTAAAEARIAQALLEAALARTGGPKPASEAPVVLYVPLNPDTVHAPSNYAKGSAFKPAPASSTRSTFTRVSRGTRCCPRTAARRAHLVLRHSASQLG